ncbi:MAG: STY4534 family ICE replication protein [Betaproteobacteria bacterium]|nr:STY4534 family ICE replication protein [Betaproteobacteria bacterium]
MSDKTASTEKQYYDLHTTGIGYLNRIREVEPKKGKPFLACDVAAIVGPSDEVEYRRFDCTVSGKEAQNLVRRCAAAVEAEKKVLIRFTLGDLWTDIFTYEKGEKKGQQAVSLKARLLRIDWIKVNGELVYQAEKKPNPEPGQDAEAEADNGTDMEETATELSPPQDGDDSEAPTELLDSSAADSERSF